MDHAKLGDDVALLARDILGYLNFSSGAPDPRFLKNFSDLFGRIEAAPTPREPVQPCKSRP